MSSHNRFAAYALFVVAAVQPRFAAAQGAATASDTARIAIPISLYGEVRTRSEWDRPMLPAPPSDFFTLMRSRLGLRINPTPAARVVFEIQDSRVLGDVSSTARQSFDLHQGFLEFNAPVNNTRLMLRAGRQEIALANERLIGASGWTNTGRTFDGVRIGAAANPITATPLPAWSADAFAATLEERGAHFGANRATPQMDHVVGGLYVTHTLPSGAARAELTAVADIGADFRTYHDARRTTVDLRIREPHLAGLRLEVEGALQGGHQQVLVDSTLHRQQVRAWLAGARIGNAVNATTPLELTLGADLLSGDKAPTDENYTAFNTLYASNHAFYGLIDLFTDPAGRTKERGLYDYFFVANGRVNNRARIRGELHRMQLATGEMRDLGWDADLVMPIRLNNEASIDLGYSAFRADDGAASIGMAREGRVQHWAFVQMRAAFHR